MGMTGTVIPVGVGERSALTEGETLRDKVHSLSTFVEHLLGDSHCIRGIKPNCHSPCPMGLTV